MNGLYDAAREVQEFMQDRRWRFCIIGGLAVIRWGQPRATQDVDISLLTGFGSEAQYIDEILHIFAGRIPDARDFAHTGRVVLASASNGVPLDIALAAFPFEEQVIDRASSFEFAPGISLVTASAEDLLVLKAFAGREQDWADVEGIVTRQQAHLDWDYVFAALGPLCEMKGETEPITRLESLRSQK